MTRAASLLLLLLLAACSGTPRPAPAPTPDDGAVHVTLLHINDVYEITPVEGGKAGGLARVATVLRRLKAANPNTRMTLGGDFVSPSAIGTARVDGQRLAGRQMVAVLNATGVDVTALGNHEFDISREQFAARVAESKFPWLATNVSDSLSPALQQLPKHLIWRFTDARGRSVRLGIVSAVINQVQRPGLRYTDATAAIRAEIALIRDSVDAVVALTHLTLAEDGRLAAAIPGIDVILGGHEHENWSLRRGGKFTPIIKADANVRSVAIVDLVIRPGAATGVNSRIVTITDSIPEDPAVAAEAARWTGIAYAAFEQEGLQPTRQVVTLPVPLDAREAVIRTGENDFTRLLTRSLLAEAPDAEVALVNSGSIRIDDVIPAGPISEYDVIRILPFGGKAVVVEITGALLQRTLEQGDRNRGIGGFLLRANVERTPGGWRVGAAPLDTLRRYTVATTDFLVSGGEQNMAWLSERNPSLRMVRPLRDIRLVVIDELIRQFRK